MKLGNSFNPISVHQRHQWLIKFFIFSVSILSFNLLSAEKPNIVIIYADDLGYGDIQSYNPERGKIPTPNVDRLVSEGMRFTDAHSSSGVCSPSRYTLLTGRYHWRTRLQNGIVGRWGPPVIPPDRLTIAGLAKQADYNTGCIGKWHLGWNWPIPKDDEPFFVTGPPGRHIEFNITKEHRRAWKNVFSQSIPGGPTANGFDSYFGTDVPNWPPFCFIENDRTVGIPSEYGNPAIFKKNHASVQGPAVEGWTLEPILPELGKRASAFIKQQSRKSEPYLLYMPLTSPHTPLAVNQAWKGKSQLGPYADLVMETDAIVGQVLEAIDQSGEANNTLVVFTSDNGCAPYIGVDNLENNGHYPSGPLRGYKSDIWEGGHRVPLVVRWPGVVVAGTVNDQLIHQADLMATLAAVCETPLPDSAGEDSFSILTLLKGSQDPVRKYAVSCSSKGLPGIRDGDWKLILGPGSGGWGKGSEDEAIQLYNLKNDIGETKNLAEKNQDKIEYMQAIFESMVRNGRSTPGEVQKNDVPVVRYPK
jgi:arylsulfatase A